MRWIQQMNKAEQITIQREQRTESQPQHSCGLMQNRALQFRAVVSFNHPYNKAIVENDDQY